MLSGDEDFMRRPKAKDDNKRGLRIEREIIVLLFS